MINESTSVPVAEPQVQRVAIQGVLGSFHEIAARQFFGKDIQLDMCESFPKLFQGMRQGRADMGVVAIENSVAGSLLPNYALLRDSNFAIVGEVYLRIEHQLMAFPGQQLADIKEVHSHPMALHQCEAYFRNFPDIKLVESEDTALSAQRLREHQLKGIAAIASQRAAQCFDLEILAAGIEANKRNFTRFLIIVHEDKAQNWVQTSNKASLSFNLSTMSQRVGSLAGILAILGQYDMNLTKIQSLPILGLEWEYFFHIDLEFDDYQQYRLSLDAIRPLVTELKILGEYARGKKPQNA